MEVDGRYGDMVWLMEGWRIEWPYEMIVVYEVNNIMVFTMFMMHSLYYLDSR